jgi:hypothetical protein
MFLIVSPKDRFAHNLPTYVPISYRLQTTYLLTPSTYQPLCNPLRLIT